MDIWKWLGSEVDELSAHDPALAYNIRTLPSWVCDGEHARVDAIFPGLLASVREIDHPWLEVYVRHWWLQSKVIHRYDVSGAMMHAIDLLDRAHQPDTEGCPQSICVAQDICCAYSITDGPGYAAERIAVSQETLDRIDPNWPCWRCISAQLANALNDDNRPEEALEFLKAQCDAATDVGVSINMDRARLRSLLELGQVETALAETQRRELSGQGQLGETKRDIDLSRCLARLERFDEAESVLPAWPMVEGTAACFGRYTDALTRLIRADKIVWDLGVTQVVAHMVRTLIRHGGWGATIDVSTVWAELALDKDPISWNLAHVLLGYARRAQPELRNPERVEKKLTELGARIDAIRPEPWTGTVEEIEAQFIAAAQADSPLDFDVAVETSNTRPDVTLLIKNVAMHWRRRGFPEAARELYRHALTTAPDDPELMAGFAGSLHQDSDWVALETYLDSLPDDLDAERAQQTRWFRSFIAEERDNDLPATIGYLDQMWKADPENTAPVVTSRLADLLNQTGDYARALDAWTATAAVTDEPTNWDWDRIICATRIGRWDVVREAGARIGMEFESEEGPVDEPWSLVQVLDPNSPQPPMVAIRTGPVTARIKAITGPLNDERHLEEVIFYPDPLNPEDEDAPPIYRMIQTLKPSVSVCCPWDGPRPDPERLETFLEAVYDLGAAGFAACPDAYSQTNPETEEEQPALWIKVAFLADDDTIPKALLSLYEELAGELEHGVSAWPELLAHMGDTEGAQRHLALQETWKMV